MNKSSVTSSMLDENVSSNDGQEKLEALKTSLEKKLHEIERTEPERTPQAKPIDEPIQVASPKPLPTGIEDDELSDDELLSKVEQLKQQFSEKRRAQANKRKLVENISESPENRVMNSSSQPDALLSTDKRSAISLKIGTNKPNAILKPVILDDDDFTEKLSLEVTPSRSKEPNRLLIDRVNEAGVRFSSPSTGNSLTDGLMTPNTLIVKSIAAESIPINTSEMKNYLNNAMSQLSRPDSKMDGSIDSNSSCRKLSPSTPSRSDKRDSIRPSSPYHRSHTKESSKRYFSPEPPRHRSPRPRKKATHRSPSPIRKRPRGSPMRSRSPRKSPRRLSPRRIRRSLSPRPKRIISPIRGRPRTPPTPDTTHANRKWEPPPATDYKNSTKNVLTSDNNVPQQITRLESATTHSTPWSDQRNSAFAPYDYQNMHCSSPKRSLDERIAHEFNQPNQSYDFSQVSSSYMGQYQYATENENKIPVLSSQENYYFPPHLPQQSIPTLPSQSLPPQHVPRQHATPIHVPHATNQLSPLQHAPPQQRTFPNLIEIRQSNVDVEPPPSPFVVKGNVLEIVPKTEALVVDPLANPLLIKLEDDSFNASRQEIKIELTEEEIERREFRKAEQKLKRKQERDKRQLERFMRKEKLKLEIKHLLEVGVHTAEIKKATYNPNAVGGKSILRMNASSSNKKSVLFADGVAPGDGTSTSGGEDVAPLLRDRNKRMTKKKLDSKRRRARREASVIKKDVPPQALEITPFIDPELENMPPPLPPEGNPPARLAQPKLKSTPKLIYFHYDPRSNAMYVSPFPTTVHIPRELDQPITKSSIDSPSTSTTPDLIQKPKVCFIPPPVYDQQPPQVPAANPGLQNANPILNNSAGSADLPTPLLPMKSFNQQPPLPNSLPSSPALYPPHQTHSPSPQSFRGPVPINQQSVPLQPTSAQMQVPPMAQQWDNASYPTNVPIHSLQQPPCAKAWEPDPYSHNQQIRPHTRFNNPNTLAQQRPPHIPWDQQRHSSPLFQNHVAHPPHPPPQPPPQFHPRSNHPRFHPNKAINTNPPHQQHNQFAFNTNYKYNANANQSWNHQYRNNH
ncbi:hypothetical protein Bhyg_08224 [Pseudolycoriella hygida]|uniref:Uncharacterized protein n=1 Tax=Pseudolycoriella hygida TaxID=35572 RepID=A0A9Q0N5I9_9DIPT|nr:hypothetical protein Bhyg_08224 [Pseudolycoriella hygida]